ncbi:right-handed parallel beta-helix repeat-containing protein [Romboutsia timonensis]|uniref:right-handed parallel beta-helix repeat-containing protein n=1 Tax=Romboutsia timonensis TaxID=1776391 RepID=UPI0023F68BE6|nr:right-handed parallel beta-helix repeat-containing protein [Romboutsia timonensis]
MSLSYEVTNWENGKTVLKAEHLRKIEKGITDIISENDAIYKDEDTRKSNEKQRQEEHSRKMNEVSEVVSDIQKDYDSLQRVIIDENASANLQNQINSVNSQLEHIQNEKAYFVKKVDNTSNCTQYLNSEFKKAKANKNTTVYIESGTYYIKNLSFVSGIHYIGIGDVIFKSHESCLSSNWDCASISENVNDIQITNITFDGNKEQVPGDGFQGVCCLRFGESRNITVNNCKFKNNYYLSSFFRGCSFVNVHDNEFYDSDVAVLFMASASNNVKVYNNYIEGGTSEGISVYDVDNEEYHCNFKIYNNTIIGKDNGQSICLKHCKDVSVLNNNIQNAGTGIGILKELNATNYSENIIISNNTITGTTFSAIEALVGKNIIVSNNLIQETNQHGVLFEDSENISISNNYFKNCNIEMDNGYVIRIGKTNKVNIMGNSIENTKDLDYFIHLDNTTDCRITNNIASPYTTKFISQNSLNCFNINICNNIGNFIGYRVNSALCVNNVSPSRTELDTIYFNNSWWQLDIPAFENVFYVDTTSEEEELVCGDINKKINPIIGRIITIIMKTGKIKFLNGDNLKVHKEFVPKEGDILRFIFDGTKWSQI